MLKEIRKDRKRVLLLFLAILGLVFVRAFENQLFYDPFLQFFKYDYQNKPLPSFNTVKLFLGLFFRYVLNTILSLGIIYLLFKQLQLVKFSALLFVVLFVILMLLFFGVLHFSKQPDYLVLFYLRRFLIQPLFLVLFIPAFYYQQMVR
ncbi:MAG TPA: exosortase F system-associated protein [Flavobacterium sp.]|uniref:exosortase F system-associated membrane protein n=1 Tax=Flavobacterium sp. TaxID=239 RepID=UPI002B4B51F8|nr:exosortase F system-associated protein [Flavobacterium sp.]HLO72437.1 exosortase F system-associated protein [Flavobacterium sp.]